MTMGMVEVAYFAAMVCGVLFTKMTSTFEPDQFRHSCWELLSFTLGGCSHEHEVLSFDPAHLTHGL
jgi:hypothetical protein